MGAVDESVVGANRSSYVGQTRPAVFELSGNAGIRPGTLSGRLPMKPRINNFVLRLNWLPPVACGLSNFRFTRSIPSLTTVSARQQNRDVRSDPNDNIAVPSHPWV